MYVAEMHPMIVELQGKLDQLTFGILASITKRLATLGGKAPLYLVIGVTAFSLLISFFVRT